MDSHENSERFPARLARGGAKRNPLEHMPQAPLSTITCLMKQAGQAAEYSSARHGGIL